MKVNKAFGLVLRDAREKQGFSQEHLALESDLDRTFISLLERGLRQPSLTTLFELAKTLGCRPSELIAKVESTVARK